MLPVVHHDCPARPLPGGPQNPSFKIFSKKEAFMKSLPRVALAVVGLCSLSPSWAQDQSKLINIPADKFVVAPGGVDLRTGRYVYNETDLSIGDKEQGALTLVRSMADYAHGHTNPFVNFSHNWDIWLVESGMPTGEIRFYLHIGGRTITFEGYPSYVAFSATTDGPPVFLNFTGTLSGTPTFTVRDSDGTVINFRTMAATTNDSDCTMAAWDQVAKRCTYASEVIKPDGTRFTLDYAVVAGQPGGRARLRQVTSSRGYALLLEGSGTLVTKACVLNLTQTSISAGSACPSNALASTEYTYTYPGYLTGVKGADGEISSFTYTSVGQFGRVMGFVKPGQTQPWLTNTIQLQFDEEGTNQETITHQSFADGQSYTYYFSTTPQTSNKPTPTIAGGSYVDAAGKIVGVMYDFPILHGTGPDSYKPCVQLPCSFEEPILNEDNAVYQQTPGPVLVRDQLGRETVYDYCDPVVMAGLDPREPHRCVPIPLQSFTDPEGIKTTLEYEGNRNIKKVTRIAKAIAGQTTPSPLITSAQYACTAAPCATKPTKMIDAKGNETSFEYNTQHGGILKETQPAVQRADGQWVTPQKRYTYQQRYAWVLSGGSYVQSVNPIWLLTQMSFCRTGNPGAGGVGCAQAGDEVVTTYDYGPNSGPNNLLLRGVAVTADGQTRRTCYRYDPLGRRISETTPGANLSVCS